MFLFRPMTFNYSMLNRPQRASLDDDDDDDYYYYYEITFISNSVENCVPNIPEAATIIFGSISYLSVFGVVCIIRHPEFPMFEVPRGLK